MKQFTISEIAESRGVDPSTVLRWIQSGHFSGAQMHDTPLGKYWTVPAADLKGFEAPKRGPKPKKKRQEASK